MTAWGAFLLTIMSASMLIMLAAWERMPHRNHRMTPSQAARRARSRRRVDVARRARGLRDVVRSA